MAFSLGSCRRRWRPRRGGKGRAGCRHFHVHYHFPRQVREFSFLRLPPLFSLLPYLLIPPVLFFAVLAFLVCFGWFTLVCFVSSVLRKCDSPKCLESNTYDSEVRKNEEEQGRNKQEIAGNSLAEGTVGSATAEICIERQEIKEVFVDGFSKPSLGKSSRIASPYDFSRDEEHSSCEKLVEEVFETSCKEQNSVISYADVSSEKEHQIQDKPVDDWLDEIGSRELCALCASSNLVHLQAGMEFVANRKEAPAYANSEVVEFIDKHETRAVVMYPDDSTENNVMCEAELPDEIFAEKLVPKDIVDKQQDAQNTVTDRTNILREVHFVDEKGKRSLGNSDDTQNLNNECEISALLLDSVSEDGCSTVSSSNASFHLTKSDEEDAHDKESAEDKGAQTSGSSFLLCDSAESNQTIRENTGVPSTDDNIMASWEESSVIGRVEDEDENSCTSEGGPRRLPLIRGSPPPWWNLCGVLDVFGGCED